MSVTVIGIILQLRISMSDLSHDSVASIKNNLFPMLLGPIKNITLHRATLSVINKVFREAVDQLLALIGINSSIVFGFEL